MIALAHLFNYREEIDFLQVENLAGKEHSILFEKGDTTPRSIVLNNIAKPAGFT